MLYKLLMWKTITKKGHCASRFETKYRVDSRCDLDFYVTDCSHTLRGKEAGTDSHIRIVRWNSVTVYEYQI